MLLRREMLTAYIVAAALFGASMWAVVERVILAPPVPYSEVDVIDAEIREDRFWLVANFRKNACTFRRLSVIGSGFDNNEVLEWQDMDGLQPDHDRAAGLQTLRIVANLKGQLFDTIEVRTRHDCDGRQVDKVFMTYTVPKRAR